MNQRHDPCMYVNMIQHDKNLRRQQRRLIRDIALPCHFLVGLLEGLK